MFVAVICRTLNFAVFVLIVYTRSEGYISWVVLACYGILVLLYMYYIVTVFVSLTPLCYLELKTFEIPWIFDQDDSHILKKLALVSLLDLQLDKLPMLEIKDFHYFHSCKFSRFTRYLSQLISSHFKSSLFTFVSKESVVSICVVLFVTSVCYNSKPLIRVVRSVRYRSKQGAM